SENLLRLITVRGTAKESPRSEIATPMVFVPRSMPASGRPIGRFSSSSSIETTLNGSIHLGQCCQPFYPSLNGRTIEECLNENNLVRTFCLPDRGWQCQNPHRSVSFWKSHLERRMGRTRRRCHARVAHARP